MPFLYIFIFTILFNAKLFLFMGRLPPNPRVRAGFALTTQSKYDLQR